jgi:hypothetical protein
MLGGTRQEVSGHGQFVEGDSGSKSIRRRLAISHSVTGFSEICQALPSKIEMCSVFIGE